MDDSPNMLHIAPEPSLTSNFLEIPGLTYLSIDLVDSLAMVKMDITNIECPDNSFDVIYCSHVLEHVQDDHKALVELHRVLKPDGVAVILVPITVTETVEDLAITNPVEREKLFGQHDHVRRYGPDFRQRLEQAGLKSKTYKSDDVAKPEEVYQLGLPPNETIFLCTKQ